MLLSTQERAAAKATRFSCIDNGSNPSTFQQTGCAEFAILFTSANASPCIRSLSHPYATNEFAALMDPCA
jgi:hypothetical protein